MRIGLFTDVYLPCISGVVVAVTTLKEALEKEGHEVFIITMNENFKTRRYTKENNMTKIPGVPSFIYDYNFKIMYPFKAEKIIKKLNLDVIHSHTELTIGKLGKNMARKLNIPFIQTVHTIYEEAVDYVTKGHFSTLSKKVVTKYISNFYNKNVNEIIVPSKRVYNILKNKYKIKTPINIVPNGTNLEKFKKENKKEITKLKTKYNLTNCFVILFVGRLGYEKNISFLIEAHKKIVAKNKHAKLLIVGEGPDHNILLELTKELNLEENVIFTGKVDYEEVTNYYHLADILVTASKCETQGLTIIEALASSTVVCTIKKEVFLSVIKHQKNGILFKNKLDYVYHINHLIKSKEKLNNMKKNTVSSVKEYSLEYYAKSIIKVYKKALKNKNINKNNDCPK